MTKPKPSDYAEKAVRKAAKASAKKTVKAKAKTASKARALNRKNKQKPLIYARLFSIAAAYYSHCYKRVAYFPLSSV